MLSCPSRRAVRCGVEPALAPVSDGRDFLFSPIVRRGRILLLVGDAQQDSIATETADRRRDSAKTPSFSRGRGEEKQPDPRNARDEASDPRHSLGRERAARGSPAIGESGMRMLIGCFMDSQRLCDDHPRCAAAREGDWACEGCQEQLRDDGFCEDCDQVPVVVLNDLLSALSNAGCGPIPRTLPPMVIRDDPRGN